MKILFIGNSYTYYNDMPQMLEKLIQENGKDAEVDAVTRGGRKLYENLEAEDEKHLEICALAAQNKYDVLFLQEQSFFPLVDSEKFEHAVACLVNSVGAKRSILYATWGRKRGCELLEQYGWTSKDMTFRLDEAYQKAAASCGAEVSRVGMCFSRISECYPEAELYNKDLSHPSYLGSCVAALSHYKKIFGEIPIKHSVLNIEDHCFDQIKTIVDEEIR